MRYIKKHGITLLVILGIGGLIYLSYTGNKKQYDTQNFKSWVDSTITITNNQQDLGDIPMSEGKKEIYYTIKNTSDKPVILGKSDTSCMCTDAYVIYKNNKSSLITMNPSIFLNIELLPGDEAEVVGIFDPNAHGPNATGPISRSIFIQTNSTRSPTLKFDFYGTVVK